eukprot:gene40814-50506_t
MATWSAENRLVHLSLNKQFPSVGKTSFECPQGDLKLVCQEEVIASPNPRLRRVEVSVFDEKQPERMMAAMSLPRRARGFTLVELLVAIAVLAIVAVLGWRGLDGIVRSRQALTEQMEQTRGIQLAFAQMQSDMEQRALRKQLASRETLAADAD